MVKIEQTDLKGPFFLKSEFFVVSCLITGNNTNLKNQLKQSRKNTPKNFTLTVTHKQGIKEPVSIVHKIIGSIVFVSRMSIWLINLAKESKEKLMSMVN